MSDERFLSRVTLRRDAPIAALRSVLLPDGDEQRMMTAHQLVWTLFTDSRERTRDFLWRDAGEGRFYTLSARPPRDEHGIFTIDDPKAFAPALSEGDRLHFVLRANATVSRRVDSGKRGKRGKPEDVVMHALHGISKGAERASARAFAVRTAGRAWLERQGERCGFALDPAGESESVVDDHRVLSIDHAGQKMTLGVIEYAGNLTVRDPSAFGVALRDGLGRAKAFGCGLMLVRRA
jgi:CRISPR system Cascade subunit CasE